MTKIYHNPRCSKSRQALQLLESRQIDFEVVKYLENPPTQQELADLVRMLGISPGELVRRKEKLFKELGLDEKTLTDKQWLAMLTSHPKLIERPIVVHEGNAVIGRPPESVLDLLESS